MNRAEYIIAQVGFARVDRRIDPNTAADILSEVASLLNSGAPDIDDSVAMHDLWHRVSREFGRPLSQVKSRRGDQNDIYD